ncbi:MAG: DUF3426 domain-containing protein [Rhodoferax sp.]
MSLITRCPACQTLFRVAPDQLRISEGWVRCGQCQQTFDASMQLLTPSQHRPTPEPDRAPDPALPETVNEAAAVEAIEPPAAAESPARPDEFPNPEPESVAEPAPATFLRPTADASHWRRPLTQAALGVASGALLLGLAGQIVLHERDRIAVQRPDLKPWLLAMCGPFKCGLSPLKEKNSIVLEGASFNKITGDSYRLNFTLKNTSTVALAVPAIELTLTDSQDQPVLRRVFLPAELDLKSDALAASSDATSSLAMTVNLASAPPIVGYRLYAFYP